MKTIIINMSRGFKGLRTRFAFEILRFLNDLCGFLPLFPQKIEKWPKMHTFLTLVQNRVRQICQDISNFVELFFLYKLIILSLAGKLWKKSYGQITKKIFLNDFSKKICKRWNVTAKYESKHAPRGFTMWIIRFLHYLRSLGP